MRGQRDAPNLNAYTENTGTDLLLVGDLANTVDEKWTLSAARTYFLDEPTLVAMLNLQDLQGAVTDAQVPDNITITLGGDLSGTAGAALLGSNTVDSAELVDGSIDHSHLADDAVSGATDRTAFASGDKLLIFETGVGLRKIDYDDLPGAGGTLQYRGGHHSPAWRCAGCERAGDPEFRKHCNATRGRCRSQQGFI